MAVVPVPMPARGFRVFRALAALILIPLASLIVVACAVEPEPTATPLPTPTPIAVTAISLQSERDENKVAWEDRYVDNYLLITGIISSISEAGSQYDIKLDTDNGWVDIVCKVSQSNRSSVLNLRKGEMVTVYGQATDGGIIDIVVRDCSIRPPQ